MKEAKNQQRQSAEVNVHLPPAWRVFAEAFAVTGDWMESYMVAYPRARAWKNESLHSAINRIRKRPQVVAYIHQLRLPVMEKLAYDYEWMVKETARQYYATSLENDRKNALAALRQMGRLLGLDFVEMARLHFPPSPPEVEPEMSDDEYAALKERVRRAFAAEDRVAEQAGKDGKSEDLDAPFRELLERVSNVS